MSRIQVGSGLWAIVAAFAALLSAPTAAKEMDQLPHDAVKKSDAIKLQPSSGWNIEVAKDRCILSRTFGSESNPHLLYIEQIAPGPHFDMTVAGSTFEDFRLGRWTYLGMRSDRNLSSIDPLIGAINGFGKSMVMPNIALEDTGRDSASSAQIDPEAAAMVERVVFRQAGLVVSFETGSIGPAMEALNTCARDLLYYWQIETETHASYYPPKLHKERTTLAKLSHRFAKSAGRKGHSAVLRIRAVIDAAGDIESCYHEYAASSGGDEIDVCKELSAETFTPATDLEGNAIRSFYSRSIALDPYSPFAADAHGGRIDAD